LADLALSRILEPSSMELAGWIIMPMPLASPYHVTKTLEKPAQFSLQSVH